ncbi:NUDIX domain-containing protein [Actinoplanes sp. Pm04-4]|uniref:NUDIX domain-containing protein n=1 Tax=Paractinoplanes pyxinae TaxID=2997416 RepID=A0ABT4BC64_9ACTN|nr:NUDIX domain-containing protein [Actinoplanes pyxinae]MCY1144101.1 NUDIX domain-containing protein [Actinoplanes pyxinae]
MINATPISAVPYLSPQDAQLAAGTADPSYGAVGLVVDPEDRVLIQLRDDKPEIVHPGLWSIPGGLADPGEDAHATVIRELYEELQLTVTDPVTFGSVVDREGRGHILAAFLVRTEATIDDLVLGEGQEMRFCAVDEALQLDLVPFARRLIEALAAAPV